MNYIKKLIWSFTKEGIEAQRVELIQKNCRHEHWNCDTQIRVIECKSCGLRAHIDDYVDLFSPFKKLKCEIIKCRYLKNGKCTDTKEYVNKLGEPVCGWHDEAILISGKK